MISGIAPMWKNYGWLGWAKNGQAAGTTKCSYRIEAIQIKLVSKDASAPGKNSGYYTEQKYNIGPDAGMYAKANLYSSSTPYIVLVNRGNKKRWHLSGMERELAEC